MHFIMYCVFFLLATYFQALYFYKTYVIANVILVLYVMFLVYGQYKDGQYIRVDYLTFYLLGFMLLYILSIFYGVNEEGAVQEAIRVSGYLPAFLVGIYLTERQRRYLEDAIIVSAVFVCIMGLAAFLGIIDMQGAIYEGRIQSTIGYANTTGLYFLLAIVTCVNTLKQVDNANKGRHRFFVGAFYILACGLILAFSRGVFLLAMFTACFALFSKWWIQEKTVKVQCIFIVGLAIMVSLILIIVEIIWVGALAILLGVILCLNANKICMRCGWKILWIIPIMIVVAFIQGAHISLRIGWFVPTEWQARIGYYKGAMNMISDYPIWGAGARSFELLWQTYIVDYTKYVHNYYLQILCDVGLVGFGFFLVFIMGIIRSLIQTVHKNEYTFIMIAIILLHALVDVGFHFQLIAIIFFIYCGEVRKQLIIKN